MLGLRGEVTKHRYDRLGQVFGLSHSCAYQGGVRRNLVNQDLRTVRLIDGILQHDVVMVLLKQLRIRQPHPRESQSNGFHNY